jgi:hypothetical protein
MVGQMSPICPQLHRLASIVAAVTDSREHRPGNRRALARVGPGRAGASHGRLGALKPVVAEVQRSGSARGIVAAYSTLGLLKLRLGALPEADAAARVALSRQRTHGQQFKARFLRTSPPTSADEAWLA